MTEDSNRKTRTRTSPGPFFFKNHLSTGKIVDHSIYGQVPEPKSVCLQPPGPPPHPAPTTDPSGDAELIKCIQSIQEFIEKHGLAENDCTQILAKYQALTGENTDSYFEPKTTSPIDLHDPAARSKNIATLHALVDKTVQEKKLLISKYDMTLMDHKEVSSELIRIKADIRKRGSKGFGGLAESLLHVDYGKFSQPGLQRDGSGICDRQRTRIGRYSRFKVMWF